MKVQRDSSHLPQNVFWCLGKTNTAKMVFSFGYIHPPLLNTPYSKPVPLRAKGFDGWMLLAPYTKETEELTEHYDWARREVTLGET